MDIQESDSVYHRTNDKLKMVVVELFVPRSVQYAKCRWVDVSGNVHTHDFRLFELIKIYENNTI